MIETIVKIDGMMCGMCESHICDCIRRNFNVKKASASRSKGQAVILSESPISAEQLKEKIGMTGYTVLDVQSKPYRKKKLFGLF